MSAGWGLAVDYGTSFTAAAVGTADGVEVLEVEDSRRFPSSVLLSEGETLLVGRGALNQARRFPDRFERSPKRLLGQPAALLGGSPVEVVAMVAAVLERVAEAARTRQGQAAPDWVRMTNPAGWGRERQDVLREAARRAGLGEVELLTEPEAAAWFFVRDRRGEEPVAEPGQCVAVYDLGGGTFDTAILRRSHEGFELAGPPGGLDWFGGEDFDQRLYDWVLGRVYELDVETWRQLKEPDSAGWRRVRLQLREDVRQAKEALSTMAHVSVPVSKGEEVLDVEVTRAEFEELIGADLRRTVDILEKTARDANVSGDEIAAVYLTGGSSRVPLAAALAAQFHPHTYTRPDPKTLVAQGALWQPNPQVRERAAPAAAPPEPEAPPPAPEAPPPAPEAPPPPPEPPKPLCRRGPRVRGKPIVGRRLNADAGNWAPGTDLSIQWLRRASDSEDWSTVAMANGTSYELTEADVDRAFAVRVRGTDGERAEEVESNILGRVRPARPPRRQRTAQAKERVKPEPEEKPKPKEPKPTRRPSPEPTRQAKTPRRGARSADAEASAPPPRPKQAKTSRAVERPRAAVIAAIGVGLVGAGVLGLVLGGGGSSESSPPAFTGSASSDALKVRFTDDWRRAQRPQAIPGLALSDAVDLRARAQPAGTLTAGISNGTGATLLPESFLRRLDGAPSTDDTVKLGALNAYRFSELNPGDGAPVRVYTSPTTAGVVTVACSAKAAADDSFWDSCETVAGTLRLERGEPLVLGPSKEYADQVSAAVRVAERARGSGLKAMRNATRPAGQAEAARNIAAAYDKAGRSLKRADPPPAVQGSNTQIVASYGAASTAYRRLARNAAASRKEAYNSDRRAVNRRDKAVRRAVRQLREFGYEVG